MIWMICIIALVMFLIFAMNDWNFLAFICFIVAIGTGMVGWDGTEWMKEHDKEMAAEASREATPHVIREVDGCKVYAFKTDRDHYFTRCGSTVTTETNWSKSCGKNCVKHESDTIVTEGNK